MVRGQWVNISDEELLEKFKKEIERLGSNSKANYDRFSNFEESPSSSIIATRFGNYGKALKLIGKLEYYNLTWLQRDREEVRDKVWRELIRQNNLEKASLSYYITNYNKAHAPSSGIIYQIFGGWVEFIKETKKLKGC